MLRPSLFIAGLTLATSAMAEAPKVVTDIAPVHGLVSMVMQGVGAPDLILAPGMSAHDLALRPSQANALSNADVVVFIGDVLNPQLAGYVETLAEGAVHLPLSEAEETLRLPFRESPIFELMDHDGHDDHAHDDHDGEEHDEHAHDDHHGEEHDEHAHDDHHDEEHDEHAHDDHDEEHDEHAHDDHDDEEHDEHAHDDHHGEEHDEHAHDDHHDEEHDEHAHDDHDGEEHDAHDDHAEAGHHGHDHGDLAFDPHLWLSPKNAVTWLQLIADALAAQDPDHADTYMQNAAAAADQINAAADEAAGILAPAQGKPLLMLHDAFQYYEAAFDLTMIGAVSNSDDIAAGPRRLAHLRAHLAENPPACMLLEPAQDPRLLRTVTEAINSDHPIPMVELNQLGGDLDLGATLYPALLTNLAVKIADCAAQ